MEKEWCSFGHMFGLRAHSDSPTESSPVFLQWLDAVWQVTDFCLYVACWKEILRFTTAERIVLGAMYRVYIAFFYCAQKNKHDEIKMTKQKSPKRLFFLFCV